MPLAEHDYLAPPMFPPTVVEAVLRLGWIPEESHGQALVAIYQHPGKELILMRSIPHFRAHVAPEVLARGVALARAAWLEVTDPEPF